MSLRKSSVETALLLNNARPRVGGGDSRHPGSLQIARVIKNFEQLRLRPGRREARYLQGERNKLKHKQAVGGGLVMPPAASITRYLPQRKQNGYI